MAATANNLISVSDYTAIRNAISTVMGTGSGSYGYGQSIISSANTEGSLISQSDWDNLRYDIINARIHQTGAAYTATTNASNSGNLIYLQFASSDVAFLTVGMAVFGSGTSHPITTAKYITQILVQGSNTICVLSSATESIVPSGTTINFGPSTLSDFQAGTLVSSSAITSYESLTSTAASDTQRFLVASGQFLTQAATSTSREWSAATAPQFWSSEINCVVSASFASADQARYFFNSGGEIRIQSTRTGGSVTSQNNAWGTLLTTVGRRSFGAQIPLSGFGTMNGQNFYRLTSTYQAFYSLASSSPYASNRYVLEARCNVANNSSGGATLVEIRVRFIDGYTDPGPPAPNDGVDGLFSVVVDEKKASGKLVPTGTFSVASPSYSITTLSGS